MWKKPESADLTSTPTSQSLTSGFTTGNPELSPREAKDIKGDKALIGGSLTFKGELTGSEDLLIQGTLEGVVQLKQNTVTLGKSGKVKGDLHAKVVHVEGEIVGDIFGNEQVVVHRSGKVRGNITAPRVILEDGAKLQGSIDMEPLAEVKTGVESLAGADKSPDTASGNKPRVAGLSDSLRQH